jgi:hypothetical protein
MYASVFSVDVHCDQRTSIPISSAEVRGGPLDLHFTNSTQTNEETPDVRYFFRNTLWIIPRHTRHPLNSYVKVPDIRDECQILHSWAL